jgi:hypothetical protein
MLAGAAKIAPLAGLVIDTLGGALTFTVALADPPFAEAVIVALPDPTVVTGIDTLAWFAAKAMLEGTVATATLLLLTLNVPDAVGVGDSAAVSVPFVPSVNASGFGASPLGVGMISRYTVRVTVAPRVPPTVNENEFWPIKVTDLSTCVRPPAKSAAVMIVAPFRTRFPVVRMLGAESCTRTSAGPEPLKVPE